MGLVENAVRRQIAAGTRLETPMQSKPFVVDRVDELGVVLLLGKQETPTRITWECLEGIPPFLAGRGDVRIGSVYEVSSIRGSLDEYLKRHVNRATAAWVAALLENAGILRIRRTRPATVTLVQDEK